MIAKCLWNSHVVHRLFVIVLLLTMAMPARWAAGLQREVSRIVAIGDIHGDDDALNGILKSAGVIDAGGRWIASNTTLVQVGDFTDRGPKVRAAMDLLMDLEQQAAKAGGRVAVLLGNHEVMNLVGDWRYITPAIYETFADQRSAQRRQQAYEAYVKLCSARFAQLGRLIPGISQPVAKDEWMAAHPLGFVEYHEAFGPRGRYGRWLRTKPVVLQLGDTVFLHAGINPDRAPRTLEEINKQVQAEIRRFDEIRRRMVDRRLILPFFTSSEILAAAQVELQIAAAAQDPPTNPDPLGLSALQAIGDWSIIHPDGPLWFRGFATWPSDAGSIQIKNLLQRYNVSHFVVGHTIPEPKRITRRFSGAVFLIDTGMSSSYVKDGMASALEIRDGRFTAIYASERVPLLEGVGAVR
jgi:hypothetical protein